jgi:hypothetical protein
MSKSLAPTGLLMILERENVLFFWEKLINSWRRVVKL